ncbi:MAG TPA: phospholipid carrier-dependent glycosyltransferase, partial [Acidimicrobiales bacterium]|nr:phospholipid carrier-dependent glycosyltransferase [Acidimicrobiales bacterium]
MTAPLNLNLNLTAMPPPPTTPTTPTTPTPTTPMPSLIDAPARLGRRTDPTAAATALRHRNLIAIGAVAAVALALLLFQAFLHGHLSAIDEYDDGVYFGASIELWHGIIPYRDFAFVQPPLITAWLLPFAALASWSGTAVAMEAARLFVDAIAVLNVILVGLLLRRRSTAQVILATGIMALYQGTISSAQTILLEPFLVLLCLLALLCILEGNHLTASLRRTVLCGVLFGVAGATKIWAIFPLLAVLATVWPLGPPMRRRLVGGAALGFIGSCLPFIAAAPANFIQQVFITQAIRSDGGYAVVRRLADLTGSSGVASLVTHHGAVGLLVLALMLALAVSLALYAFGDVRRRPWTALEKIALLSTVFLGVGLLLSPTYYYHYSGIAAPFLALTVTAGAARIRQRQRLQYPHPTARLFTFPTLTTILALLGVMAASAVDYISTATPAAQVADAVSDVIPSRGCVLYVNPTVALLDDR